MWNDEYESLSSSEKDEFRRLANSLLSHTYLSRPRYSPAEQTTLTNRDYQRALRFFPLLQDYFAIMGWRLERDDNYGFMSLRNQFGNNRYRLDQFTTLFLYTCRLIYEERREQDNSFHMVKSSTPEVVQKMTELGLRAPGKTTQKERLEAARALAHFNIIEKMETTAWDADGNQILILPSILAIVPNHGINDMMRSLEEMNSGGPAEPAADEPGGEAE